MGAKAVPSAQCAALASRPPDNVALDILKLTGKGAGPKINIFLLSEVCDDVLVGTT